MPFFTPPSLATGTTALLGTAQTFTAAQTYSGGTNSATPTILNQLINSTAAISGTQSASPALVFSGQAYKVGVGSQQVDWRIYNLPIQGSSVDTGLRFGYQVNSGGYTDWMRICGLDTVQYKGLAFATGFNLIPSLTSDATRFFFDASTFTITFSNVDKISLNSSTLTFGDAVNIATNTSTGTKICTATTQKIAFWNATPVVQPAHIADPSGGAVVDAEARTAINSILAWQATLGLTAAA